MAAPPWVLLHRTVQFVHGEAAGTDAASKTGGESSREEAMAAMKPATVIAVPPEVSYMSILRQSPARNMWGIHDGEISSTDEGLVVLYGADWLPCSGHPEAHSASLGALFSCLVSCVE
jgi:hypothetical protein